jgi:ATP-dependent DNA helicase Rep
VRDVLAYLRLVANEDDDPAFIRAATTPKRGIGQATLQTLGQYAGERQISLFEALFEQGLEGNLATRQLEPLRTFGEFINRIRFRAGRGEKGQPVPAAEPAGVILDDLLSAIQYERYLYDTLDEKAAQSRWQNVLELVGWLKRKAEADAMGLLDLVQHVALVTMLERGEEQEPDAVKLSTLHASKGLEYPHVYLLGVEEGLLPHLGRDDEDVDPTKVADALASRIQEERRLMYVGITRAQRSLHLSWCQKRRRAREDLVREPSRFIEEMGLSAAELQLQPDTLSPKNRLDMLRAMLNKTS